LDPAIDTLLNAAKSAYPTLGGQLTFEAARKATEAKEYARARELITPLLRNQPYNAEYLAAMGDTYAREGDDKSLRDFYVAQIQASAPQTCRRMRRRHASRRCGAA